MKFPKWSLFLFPILVIVLITMFPVLAIVVAVAVATWVVIAVQKAAGTNPQDILDNFRESLTATEPPDSRTPSRPRSLPS